MLAVLFILAVVAWVGSAVFSRLGGYKVMANMDNSLNGMAVGFGFALFAVVLRFAAVILGLTGIVLALARA